MDIKYKTPDGVQTVSCNRFTSHPGEGVNGPFVLAFFRTDSGVEYQSGGASRVIQFEVLGEFEHPATAPSLDPSDIVEPGEMTAEAAK